LNKKTSTSFTPDILTFVPKGSFYNTQDEQVQVIEQKWQDCLSEDRELFALSTILPGSAFSKGRMNYYMLANPGKGPLAHDKVSDSLVSIDRINNIYQLEPSIIQHNLDNESIPRALKNCLMLVDNRVNNRRTQKIILRYIFDRDIQDIINIAIKYKQKLARLIRHALGKQNLYNILNHDGKLFHKYIGKYCLESALSLHDVIYFLFDKSNKATTIDYKLGLYTELRRCAKVSDIDGFMLTANKKVLPIEVLIGFRNTYKLDIPLSDVLETGKMSDRQNIQLQSTAQREDVEVEIDYKKQDIYDLWKLFYAKVFAGNIMTDELVEAIDDKSKNKLDIDIGRTVVIMDASRSMEGSDKRFLHPFLTGLSLITVLPNVKEVLYVGGKLVSTSQDINHREHPLLPSVVIPSAATKMWSAFKEALTYDVDSIVIISDGYENSVKGAFEYIYKRLHHPSKIYHINPVFASETASARRLSSNLEPMVIDDYRQLKTNLIFRLLQTDKVLAKNMLVSILAQSKGLSTSERSLLP